MVLKKLKPLLTCWKRADPSHGKHKSLSFDSGWMDRSLKPNDYFTLFSLHLRFCAIFDHSRITLRNKNIKIPGTYLGYLISTNTTNKFSIQSQVWFAISTYLKPKMVTLQLASDNNHKQDFCSQPSKQQLFPQLISAIHSEIPQ